jgi:hypothetical protein
MQKIVLIFGLIAGFILSAMMMRAMLFKDAIGFDRGLIVGYTSMVIAFLLIYFGVRSYRDNVAGGTVRFGRAFSVGALIALVAALCYVATWEVIYYSRLMPNYLTEYREHALAKARAEGKSEQAIALQRVEMEKFAKLYENPFVNSAVTFLEPLPVALIISLVSAAMLSRRRKSALGVEQ